MIKKVPAVEALRHSLAHLLAAAVRQRFPGAKLGIGPAVENGFYYDFVLPRPLAESDLPALESAMREMIAASEPFAGEKVTAATARKIFKDQPFKLELIADLVKEKAPLTVYRTGAAFVDLCRGGHVENTGQIFADAFALDRVAGAYWRGDAAREQMTRVYGLAFVSKKELEEYSARRAEAEKRDHKKLGPVLDLFTFSNLVGGGLPLWTPKGTILRDLLDNFVWELRRARGYERVDIPHLGKRELYEKSGHWEKFKDELFHIKTREGHDFTLKPMNCPHHIQLYARRPWSYRELPQRYASTTKVYRDEQSGELAGLSRVRAITQDDAHVFCRRAQTKHEIGAVWDIVEKFYGVFGFALRVRLSLRDPKSPKNYLGDAKVWDEAETEIRAAARSRKTDFFESAGEAAFYGPKVDFMAKDSLGREWQVATIQLDMNQPERFDLVCVNEKGERERVVMLHAAIMGSIERFLAVLIEHYAGAFPFWLAPEQVRVLPLGQNFLAYGEKVRNALLAADVRATLDASSETLGKRLREGKLAKVPYLLIVGEKEERSGTVALASRDGNEGEMTLDAFLERASREIREKK